MKCIIENCDKAAHTKQLCRRHYLRQPHRLQKDKQTRNLWRIANPEKVNASLRRWRAKNPEKTSNFNLQARYGISLDDKIRLYRDQKGLCALCSKPLSDVISKCCTDHNHQTRTVRALLHHRCNMALGHFEENPELLTQIPAYLSRFAK